jgi:hypothetical protein
MIFEILIGAWLVGDKVVDFIHDRRESKKAPEPICGCGHHLANHDPATGICHDIDLESVYSSKKGDYIEKIPCTCRQYVGPMPIAHFWTPGVIDSSRHATPHEITPKDDMGMG